jgi:diguanylate cyclase (GGDEF)-like protein
LRLDIARHDAPRVLSWSGLLVVVFSLVSFLIDRTGGFAAHAADISVGLLMAISGSVLRRPSVPPESIPKAFAALTTLLVLAFLFEIWHTPSPLAMAYVLIVMCAFGAPTLEWRPFIAAAVVMAVASAVVSSTWAGDAWLDWVLASVTALLISAVLLRARLRSVTELAAATAFAQRLATTDNLTGMLNRYGMKVHLPGLTSMARRLDQQVFVVYIDIDGLKAANDRHGHAFGDRVITTASAAVAASVRENDLVARWGGDELIVIGFGAAPDAVQFGARVHDHIAHSGLNLAWWPGKVSIGTAAARPDEQEIAALIDAADDDMYRRRESR